MMYGQQYELFTLNLLTTSILDAIRSYPCLFISVKKGSMYKKCLLNSTHLRQQNQFRINSAIIAGRMYLRQSCSPALPGFGLAKEEIAPFRQPITPATNYQHAIFSNRLRVIVRGAPNWILLCLVRAVYISHCRKYPQAIRRWLQSSLWSHHGGQLGLGLFSLLADRHSGSYHLNPSLEHGWIDNQVSTTYHCSSRALRQTSLTDPSWRISEKTKKIAVNSSKNGFFLGFSRAGQTTQWS